MKIVWFTWKDGSHPHAGGAELLNELIATELAARGHEIIFIVAGYPGSTEKEIRNGFTIIRLGNQFTVYLAAARYFFRNLKTWPDVIIEEMNTIPFFVRWYTRIPVVFLTYQLCREIWFYQIGFPLNLIGYLLEPLYLRLVHSPFVLTESRSTRDDLMRYGFSESSITIMPVALKNIPIPPKKDKFQEFTVLSLGAMRPMKRTLDQLRAFEIAFAKCPNLRMILAGSAESAYGSTVLEAFRSSPARQAITYKNVVSEDEKIELMQQSHVILGTSVKEGWGLTVTEAARLGTPAIVYNVDGLRDSVMYGQTGLITSENTPDALAQAILRMHDDAHLYHTLTENAVQWSSTFSIERTTDTIEHVITLAYEQYNSHP